MLHTQALAIIQAGGFGTRLKDLAGNVPKPLVALHGRPVLFRQIDSLLTAGIKKIFVLGGYRGDILREAIQTAYGEEVEVFIESQPLGSGGCLSLLKGRVDRTAFLISGDLVFDVDFSRLFEFHKNRRANLTLSVHPNLHPRDSDLVDMDDQGKVESILTRPHPRELRYQNLVNAAISIVEPILWDIIPDQTTLNFENDLVKKALRINWPVFAYKTSEYIKDMGTPERWQDASNDLAEGRVDARSMRRPQRAIFLKVTSCEELMDQSIESIKRINSSKFLLFVIYAQPTNSQDVRKEVDTYLGDRGAKLDDMYIVQSLEGQGSNIFNFAAERYRLDLKSSFVLSVDKEAISIANRIGCRTILLGEEYKENGLINRTLAQAINQILSN